MQVFYCVAKLFIEHIIADIICASPLLLWLCIASILRWRKEKLSEQYVKANICHCGAQKVSGANHCKSCGYISC
jgi:ribosomal protein L40E